MPPAADQPRALVRPGQGYTSGKWFAYVRYPRPGLRHPGIRALGGHGHTTWEAAATEAVAAAERMRRRIGGPHMDDQPRLRRIPGRATDDLRAAFMLLDHSDGWNR